MSKAKVSVILPVYNGENFVREAIESVLGQTWRDFEFLILDNASTDRTPQICRAYADRDTRIRYYRHPKNLGAAANHNAGFQLSAGEYVKYIAHDDVWEPTLLEKSVRILDENPGVILVYPKTVLIDEMGNTIEWFDPKAGLQLHACPRSCALVCVGAAPRVSSVWTGPAERDEQDQTASIVCGFRPGLDRAARLAGAVPRNS